MSTEKRPVTILYAEDDPDDRMLAADAFKENHHTFRLETVNDGRELLDYLLRLGRYTDPSLSPRPGLILLDLNMPRLDGREALAEIKAHPELRRIPVVVMTTSRAETDILRSYDLGAASYIVKPVTFASLVEVLRDLGRYWFEIVALPEPGA